MKSEPAERASDALDLLVRIDHREASVFRPERLMAESRRQRNLRHLPVPRVCLLDPDGDVVRHLIGSGRAALFAGWACYHTELVEARIGDLRLGVVGNAVGAPFAVLVAEQLFASGCALLLSVTSAGRVGDGGGASGVIIVERALRGEGTSVRYLPPAPSVAADPAALALAEEGLAAAGLALRRGVSWTTDAPFRETASALAAAGAAGAVAVEMEAAGLYAFAEARGRPVVCFAHLTNQMGQVDLDFEKGPAGGAEQALAVAAAAAEGWLAAQPREAR